MSQLMNWRDL